MSQHEPVRFLQSEALPADIIHEHLIEVFGGMAMKYSTVTRTIREMSWTPKNIPKGRPPNVAIDTAILRVLARDPAASPREIADEAKLPLFTVYYVLTIRIGYKFRRCRFVPHALSAQQKEARLTQSRELLQVLENAKRLRWRFILTEDEAWSSYVNERQKLWLPPDADAPKLTRRLINTPKVMITLFWNMS
jgi:hypothetical protein